jgi:hypothetical protein
MATPQRTERLQVEIDREMLKAIEDFRLRERILTKSDAARKLLMRSRTRRSRVRRRFKIATRSISAHSIEGFVWRGLGGSPRLGQNPATRPGEGIKHRQPAKDAE